MAERYVTVEGVRMTRTALEKALEEINQPTFLPGDVIRYADHSTHRASKHFLVVSEATEKAHRAMWGQVIAREALVVVGLDDGESYSGLPSVYEKVR